MKQLLFLVSVLVNESKKRNFIPKALLVTLLYISVSILLINYKSYLSFLLSDYSFIGKAKVLLLIYFGSFQALTTRDTILLLIVAILFGVNVELVLRKIKFIASYGSLHITIGTGLITLVATGCASCGLSIASIVGLSAVLAALPFHGVELYILSITILILSLTYNLHTLVEVCKIRR